MVQTNYSFKTISDKMARAYGKSLPISTKVSINICNALRGMTVDKALAYLQDVVDEKRAIPFTRFNDGVGPDGGPVDQVTCRRVDYVGLFQDFLQPFQNPFRQVVVGGRGLGIMKGLSFGI